MKLKIAALVAFVFVAFAAQSQISVGAKAGLNLASQSWTGVDSLTSIVDFKSLPLYSFGAVLEVGVTENFAIQAEANYTAKGGRQEFSGDLLGISVSFKSDIIVNYLDIPVLAKYSFGGESAQGYVLAGPNFSYAFSGKVKSESTNSVTGTEKTTDDINFKDDEYNRTDLGFNLGLGAQFGLSDNMRLFADARYNLGLANMNTSDAAEDADLKVKNRGIGINVGVLYGL
ncbi:MAG: PorT family protein [Saprospiraceae bacterium]|nr:PorT family protein [Saprospiraceae bacterium]